jgi:hypothetical protein
VKRRLYVVGADNPAHVFDDLDALRREGAQPTKTRRARIKETFARVPHDRAHQLACHGITAAAWAILIEIDRLILHGRGRNPIRLTNHRLKQAGIDRYQKRRALCQLEDAGAIRVLPGAAGRAPLVLHLWFPRQD